MGRLKFSTPPERFVSIYDLNTCRSCACNKICNHNEFGYENCDNYIPLWINSKLALPENDRYVLVLSPESPIRVEVVYFAMKSPYMDNWAERFPYWMPIPDFGIII